MKDRNERCVPERQIHAFNGNAICECGAMNDDGEPVQAPVLVLAPSPTSDAGDPPVVPWAMTLREGAEHMKRFVDNGVPMPPEEVELVLAAINKTLRVVGATP